MFNVLGTTLTLAVDINPAATGVFFVPSAAEAENVGAVYARALTAARVAGSPMPVLVTGDSDANLLALVLGLPFYLHAPTGSAWFVGRHPLESALSLVTARGLQESLWTQWLAKYATTAEARAPGQRLDRVSAALACAIRLCDHSSPARAFRLDAAARALATVAGRENVPANEAPSASLQAPLTAAELLTQLGRVAAAMGGTTADTEGVLDEVAFTIAS